MYLYNIRASLDQLEQVPSSEGSVLVLLIANTNGKYKVLYKNLRFAETDKHNVLLHFDGQTQTVYKSMKEISLLLCAQPQFARCHQSFVVNLAYIERIDGLDIRLTTGEHIPISQPKRKEFMQKLTESWDQTLVHLFAENLPALFPLTFVSPEVSDAFLSMAS